MRLLVEPDLPEDQALGIWDEDHPAGPLWLLNATTPGDQLVNELSYNLALRGDTGPDRRLLETLVREALTCWEQGWNRLDPATSPLPIPSPRRGAAAWRTLRR